MKERVELPAAVMFIFILAAFTVGFLTGFWQGNKTHKVELVSPPTGSINFCISYVDALGNESPCEPSTPTISLPPVERGEQ